MASPSHVCAQPSGVFAACTDLQGRVLLMHVPTFSVVRVFKGYRDAQVHACNVRLARNSCPSILLQIGWTHGCLLDPHCVNGGAEASALYLSIYAPRKCTLEVKIRTEIVIDMN